MSKYYLYAVIMLLGAGTAKAQEVVPLSLEQCMDYAMKHNYAIKNARIDVSIQEAQVKQSLAAAYPHINGRAEFDDYVVPQQTFFPTGSFGSIFTPFLTANPTLNAPLPDPNASAYSAIQISPQYSATASLSGSQALFDGSVLVALQARKTVLEMARQAGDVTEETVRYNVYKAYNSLVIAYRQFNITKDALTFSRSVERDVILTHQNGMAEKIDVERTTVQINNLATDSMRISNLLTTSEQMLKYQIGMDINTPIALTDTNIEARRSEVLALINENENYDRVPEYILSQTQLTLNKYNLKRYQLAAYPTLNFVANAGYNTASEDINFFFSHKNYLGSVMLGLQMNVPIFNGLMRKNQVAEARLNVEKSQNNIDNLKFTLDFQTASSRTNLKNAQLQVLSQRRNLDLAGDVLDLAQRKYKEGVGSNLEVTQAQNDQLRAQNNYFSSMLDLVSAEADLKKALGLLK